MYQFTTLDPRNIPAATEANDKVFANPVYGIEVTVPALAKRCTFNPRPATHRGEPTARHRRCADDGAPAEGSTLATVRADLTPSFMAISTSDERRNPRVCDGKDQHGRPPTSFARGGYSGPKPLPHWSNRGTRVRQRPNRPVHSGNAGLSWISRSRWPIAFRTMEQWLLPGDEPAQYRTQVERNAST